MSKSQTFYYDEKTDEFIPEYNFSFRLEDSEETDNASDNFITISKDVGCFPRCSIAIDGSFALIAATNLIAAANRLISRYNEGCVSLFSYQKEQK